MQFPGHTFRAREKLSLGYGKIRNQSNNASAGMRNDYLQISRKPESCFSAWRKEGKENRDFGYTRVMYYHQSIGVH